MMVGEVYLLDVPRMASYYGRGDELHLSFNFPALYAEWDADCWREVIDTTTGALDPIDAWPTWVLSNHDNPRHRNRYGGSESRARAAAVLLLGLRGTPFLYAGEELGLLDAEVPPDRVVDPGGRDGCRAPIPWDDSVGHGWTTDPWLPLPPESTDRNVAHLRSNPASILHLYRRLLEQRHAFLALEQGDQTFLATPSGVLGWIRSTVGDDHRVILVNFTASIVELGADLDPVIVAERPGWVLAGEERGAARRTSAEGTMGALFDDQLAVAGEGDGGATVDQPADGLPHDSVAPSRRQPSTLVIAQQRFEVVARSQQSGVDLEVTGQLRHPRRDERHRRA